MSIPRRRIDELRTRYELEPELDDVYLEGAFDKEIIDAAVRDTFELFRPTYSIDDIEVSAEILESHGLTEGNRQRVVAFSIELNLPKETGVRMVVDRDFEDWHPELPDSSGLVTTKYCDVETVFFHEDFLRKVVLGAASCKITNWEDFVEGVKSCAKGLYCLRLEAKIEGINVKLADFKKSLSFASGVPVLRIDNLIERSFSQSIGKQQRENLLSKVNERLCEFESKSHQLTAHGHDFLKLVALCIRANKGQKSLQSDDALSRLLILLASDEKDSLLHPLLE